MVSRRFPTEPFLALGALAKIYASGTRLQILYLLGAGEACVCHLTTILGLRQANVSQHLMVLRDAHLVEDRRDGMMVYYRLAESRILEVVALLRALLISQGSALEMPDTPLAPVDGCPCPRCSAGTNDLD